MPSSICLPRPGKRSSSSRTRRRNVVAETSSSDLPLGKRWQAEPEITTFGTLHPHPRRSRLSRYAGEALSERRTYLRRRHRQVCAQPDCAADGVGDRRLGGTIGTSPTPRAPTHGGGRASPRSPPRSLGCWTPPGSGGRGSRRYPSSPGSCKCTSRSAPSRYPTLRRPGFGLPRSSGGSPCRRSEWPAGADLAGSGASDR